MQTIAKRVTVKRPDSGGKRKESVCPELNFTEGTELARRQKENTFTKLGKMWRNKNRRKK